MIGQLEGVISRGSVQAVASRLDDLSDEVRANYADYLESLLEGLSELRVTGIFGVPYVGDSLNAALMTIIAKGEVHVDHVLSDGKRVRVKGDMSAALDLYERLVESATQPELPHGHVRVRFIDPYQSPYQPPRARSPYVNGVEEGVDQANSSLALHAAVSEHPKIDSLSVMVVLERGEQSMEITRGKSADILIVVDGERSGGGHPGGVAEVLKLIETALRKLKISVDLRDETPGA